MQLRKYQHEAIDGILDRFSAGDQRTMAVMSTGAGKTIVFAHLAKRFHENKQGRTLVLCHRGELLDQACAKLKAITGIEPDLERADRWSTETGFDEHKIPIVVASVQSLISGKNGDKRMHRFKPSDYGLLLVDECFPAGTLVDEKLIESISVGDTVFCAGGQGRVVRTFRSVPSAMVRVVLMDGSSICCTPGHPFWNGREWVAAQSLDNGSMVCRLTHATGERIPALLQGGCGTRDDDDRYRGGRQFTLRFGATSTRSEEGRVFENIGVDRVEILERTSDGTFGGVCPDGYVYNLEVEHSHTYFANGILVHNCHHISSKSFSEVANYFTQNPKLKMCGFTATSDRLDGEQMGGHFQSVAYEYQLDRAIADGYLVPIHQRRVYIDGLDFSLCNSSGGDFNQGDLAAALMFEKPLHGIAYATIEVACGLEKDSLRNIAEDPEADTKFRAMIAGKKPKKTLLFCVKVEQAERLAEIINRWIPDSSDVVHGKLPADDRAGVFKAFHDGDISFMTSVGVCLEGYDCASIELIAMARPTKSRTIYTQAIGRGTRPSFDIANNLGGVELAEDRRAMIAASSKPYVTVLDFNGNSGRHDLICTADILGVKYDEAVVEAARAAALAGDVDMTKALETAQEDFELKKRVAEAKRKKEAEERAQMLAAEAARRVQLRGVASYTVEDIESPGYRTGPGIFEVGDKQLRVDVGEAEDGTDKITAAQLVFLRDKTKLKPRYITMLSKMGRRAVGSFMAEVKRGWADRSLNLRTPSQLMLLHSCGYGRDELRNMTFDNAGVEINQLAKNGWRRR